MRVTEYKSGPSERQILTAMILHPIVLGRIASKWEHGCFASTWSNEIAKWCIDYHNKYGEAPGKSIVGLFQSWADKNQDRKDDIRLIESLLETLSDEWGTGAKDIKVDYITDQAGEHFNKNKFSRVMSAAQGEFDNGNVDAAIAKLTEFRKIEMGIGAAIDWAQDTERIISTLGQEESNRLISYPGAIGELFGNILEVDGFVGVRAADKVGKSQVLLDMGMRAMFQRHKVAYFQVGDMSERQVLRRIYTRAALHPIRSTQYPPKWPCEVMWPVSIEHVPPIKGDRGEIRQPAKIEYEPKKFKRPLDYKDVVKACENIMYHRTKSLQSYFRLSCHPNMTMTVAGIRDTIKRWELDGYSPAVCIIDYADLLAPPKGKNLERRDQVNENWNQLRALSQELHCLVVTATQSDTEAYRKEIQDKANFSEDKRQNSHVTAMIVLNQTAAEKDNGQFRLQVVFKREEDFSPRRCVHVASCLALAHPTVRSCWEPMKGKK